MRCPQETVTETLMRAGTKSRWRHAVPLVLPTGPGCSAATAPAPGAPEPAVATTASWPTYPDLSPCRLLSVCSASATKAKYPPDSPAAAIATPNDQAQTGPARHAVNSTTAPETTAHAEMRAWILNQISALRKPRSFLVLPIPDSQRRLPVCLNEAPVSEWCCRLELGQM